jgi:hypothetical protein
MQSAWGIDHGEIEKKRDRRGQAAAIGAGTGAAVGAAGAFPAAAGGYTYKMLRERNVNRRDSAKMAVKNLPKMVRETNKQLKTLSGGKSGKRIIVGAGAVGAAGLGAGAGAAIGRKKVSKARDRVEGAKHGAEIGGYTGTALGTAAVLGHGLRKLKSQTPAQRTALKAALRHSAPKSKVGAVGSFARNVGPYIAASGATGTGLGIATGAAIGRKKKVNG